MGYLNQWKGFVSESITLRGHTSYAFKLIHRRYSLIARHQWIYIHYKILWSLGSFIRDLYTRRCVSTTSHRTVKISDKVLVYYFVAATINYVNCPTVVSWINILLLVFGNIITLVRTKHKLLYFITLITYVHFLIKWNELMIY